MISEKTQEPIHGGTEHRISENEIDDKHNNSFMIQQHVEFLVVFSY